MGITVLIWNKVLFCEKVVERENKLSIRLSRKFLKIFKINFLYYSFY